MSIKYAGGIQPGDVVSVPGADRLYKWSPEIFADMVTRHGKWIRVTRLGKDGEEVGWTLLRHDVQVHFLAL